MDLSSRGPLSLLIYSEETRLQVNIQFGTITISSTTCNLDVHALILRVGPPRMVRPMYHLMVPGGISPTVSTACPSFDRPDAGSLPDRTHKRSVRSLLQQQFTSYELTRRWTAASGVASGVPFPANLQSSSALPVLNQVPT